MVAGLTAAGQGRGAAGAVLTLSRSLIVPFLQYSPRRDLRQRAFQAGWRAARMAGQPTTARWQAEMLALRHERATLLGFPDFAAFKLDDQMARTPPTCATC